ncbi:LysR family transcriptional regulator [Streptomyces sp. NBC_01669]|uniref:helix-turn-helix domain-containing protein n=1 Tax=Streptomyces sp. NBC_01669 TaxID=2975909 RepID=UPI002258E985|nr:LysR family transcriptional regulator [Streptomyces sp. NBC_01669]MCX4538244.1 LysR family transcriptional regulator [Streptomyces sp. NBC_01669]
MRRNHRDHLALCLPNTYLLIRYAFSIYRTHCTENAGESVTSREPSRLLDGHEVPKRRAYRRHCGSRPWRRSSAAAELHMTQPVVTRAVRELAEILDVELFECCGRRGLIPTMFGEGFTEHARAILARARPPERHVTEFDDALRVLRSDHGGRRAGVPMPLEPVGHGVGHTLRHRGTRPRPRTQ